ncbi:hypothetical protein C9374_004300 [Naegleria lovaniensis]|uniref:Rab family small GTPase n=1 Tax=Naegleria lovaniensis TaxID=51637 RepID=A0AA88KJ71_NAELO|nr:uncharacterized protein C9374_004300 [Naegleria lovaniensis]KAG2383629.1 hypothetical protein C9374_004300 [Naegleria lovaniensis]
MGNCLPFNKRRNNAKKNDCESTQEDVDLSKSMNGLSYSSNTVLSTQKVNLAPILNSKLHSPTLTAEHNGSSPKKVPEIVKVLIIGEANSGKSSIVLKYTDGIFDEGIPSTVGVDFKLKCLQRGERNIDVQLWDTAGQERYRTITNSYYKGIPAVVIVFDLTDENALMNVQKWIKEVRKFSQSNVTSVLVGNKTDLIRERVISEKEGIEFAQQNDMPYFEVSAKDGSNIDKMFDCLIDRVLLG